MATARPSVLVVHCHDLGRYLGCYGAPVRTPEIDRFAAGGVRFTRAFCTAPSCSPSRAALFTGRYPHSNGVMGLAHADFAWDLHPRERHLAQALAAADYATSAVGVVHETASGPARCGYERHAPPVYAAQATDAAIAEIERFAARPDHPFLLSVGFIEPHRLALRPNECDTPGDQGFPGSHLPPAPPAEGPPPPYLRDTAAARREFGGIAAAVTHVDRQFGRIMEALRRTGLRERTLTVFTTDHGIAVPRAKCSLYDPGIETAVILDLPTRAGWTGGRVADPLLSNVDFLPTVLHAAGCAVPRSVQGISFAPWLDQQGPPPRDHVFAEMTYHDYYDPRRCIRTETHKLIVNFSTAPAFMDPSQSRRPACDPVAPPNVAVAYHPHVELYSLADDPHEARDIAGEPSAGEVRARLQRQLGGFLRSTHDPILAGAITSPHHQAAATLLGG